jgi:hypothetical protein
MVEKLETRIFSAAESCRTAIASNRQSEIVFIDDPQLRERSKTCEPNARAMLRLPADGGETFLPTCRPFFTIEL